MKLGIMQPYFFPYIGYFQLMNSVDEFIIYDNIKFTKKGWINRNRILANGSDHYITLPIKSDSDYLLIQDRYLAETWTIEREKIIRRLDNAYRKAPYYDTVFPFIKSCLYYEESNLYNFLFNSLNCIKVYLDILTPLIRSSNISINHDLKSSDKVIAFCLARGAQQYINPIGGVELYDKFHFKSNGIELNFIKSSPNIVYNQGANHEFVPWLSIIDVLMFNSKEEIKGMLNLFTLE